MNNIIIYDYYGAKLWSSGNLINNNAYFSAPMVDIYNRVVVCDNQKLLMIDLNDFDNDGKNIEWMKSLSGNTPISPSITENGVIILPTALGGVSAFDSTDGKFLYNINFPLSYSTCLNSPCINGNRLYILLHWLVVDVYYSRLYAVDVDPLASEILHIVWTYDYMGQSQATPTFIDGTLYFDSYISWNASAYIHAVIDLGSSYKLKWKIQCSGRTWFSFSKDPRGGFWYLDSDWFRPLNPGARKAFHYTENGNIIESIFPDALINNGYQYIPMSVMEICGYNGRLIMILSANYHDALYQVVKNYVIAVDLSSGNTLVWSKQIENQSWMNYAGGQYTILMDNNGANPRIVFIKYQGGVNGVMAIG